MHIILPISQQSKCTIVLYPQKGFVYRRMIKFEQSIGKLFNEITGTCAYPKIFQEHAGLWRY